jgi:hypothetical protein
MIKKFLLSTDAFDESTSLPDVSQPLIPEVVMPEVDLDAVITNLFKDVSFDIQPGLIGSLFPSWVMWDKNRKLVEVQQYTQNAQSTISTLSMIISTQRDANAKHTLNYDVQQLQANLAKLAAEVMNLKTANDERLHAMRATSERLAMDVQKLTQELRIEKEKHDMEMKLKQAEIEAKEAQATIIKQRAEEQ